MYPKGCVIRQPVKVLVASLIAVSFVFLTAISVFAVPDPDDPPTFTNIFVNRSVLEDNDFILVAQYNIPYAVLPDDPANQNFIFELIDTDGITKLGTQLCYPYSVFDNGYNYGCISFYFDATDAPTWGLNYTLRVIENPAKFPAPIAYDTTVSASAYSSLGATDSDGQRAELAQRVLVIATALQVYYGVTLLSEQDAATVFSSYGEAYFRQAIYSLQGMAPILFFIQSTDIDTTERAWGQSLSDFYKNRLNGTWFKESLENFADAINVPYMWLVGGILLVLCIIVIKKANEKWGTPVPGYGASLLILFGGSMLFIGMTLQGLVVLFLVLVGGWMLLMKRT